MSSIRNYLSLVKFSHTVFAMPFALIGFMLGYAYRNASHFSVSAGDGGPSLAVLLMLVIFCMVFCRNAAMAFNRYLDRQFDALNPRTAIREIPLGVIRSERALLFVVVNALLFVVSTFFINRICLYLSPVALAVVLGYSYTKRFTAWCHLVLGVGLSLAPIGAYLAVTGRFDILPLFFSFAVITWVSGFDIIYALQDEEFDRANRLFSIPSRWGKVRALRFSEGLHMLTAVALAMAGWFGVFSWLYWIGWGLFTAMLVYQHSIVSPSDLRRVNVAFMTANGLASVFFAAITISDIIKTNHFLP